MQWTTPSWQQKRDPANAAPQDLQLPRVQAALQDAYAQSVQQQYASAAPSARQAGKRQTTLTTGSSDPSGSGLVDPITGWITGKAGDAWNTVKGWF